MAGRVLKQLTNRRYEAGQYQVTFNASEYSSGNYLIRMHAGEYIQTQTITLVK